MNKILVTGAHGQLGTELNFLTSLLETHSFIFAGQHDLDITDEKETEGYLIKGAFEGVINCAAYTAVDLAESEKEEAYRINSESAGMLAGLCAKTGARFIHFSTDFVFDGTASTPRSETDSIHPVSVYGGSKAEGEKRVMQQNPEAVVIRTGWLYSSFGSNFVKTVLKLCRERESLGMIYDQVGTPTYARDLADATLKIMQRYEWIPGLYHYSNEGVASWYDFAMAVRDMAGLKTIINPIETHQYPTPAQRPKYSVLNKSKIKETFGLEIPYWRESLRNCMDLL